MPYRLTLKPNGKVRAQRSKDFRMAINGLMTRRYQIISEAPETLASDLASIDRSLQLLGFTEDPQDFMPRQCNQRVFRKGEMLKAIRDVLRDADRPLSSREICLTILPNTFDKNDTKRVNQVTSRVYKKLCREYDLGRIEKHDGSRSVQWISRPKSG